MTDPVAQLIPQLAQATPAAIVDRDGILLARSRLLVTETENYASILADRIELEMKQ